MSRFDFSLYVALPVWLSRQLTRVICRVFGHRWVGSKWNVYGIPTEEHCRRCGAHQPGG